MLLRVEGLRSGYGSIVVLQGVNLAIGKAEIVAVLGRNGVGKTTLMKTLAGLLPARSGTIIFAERDIASVPSHARAQLGLGYVPQGRQIFSKLTVFENLLVGSYANGIGGSRAEDLLESFPSLRLKLKQLGGSLSGGQQQLLALARALVIRPKLLLLDEPSEGIQPSILEEIKEVLLMFRDKAGLSVLLVEQNLDFANGLADRSYFMDRGRITRELASNQLLDDPAVSREFVGGACEDTAQQG